MRSNTSENTIFDRETLVDVAQICGAEDGEKARKQGLSVDSHFIPGEYYDQPELRDAYLEAFRVGWNATNFDIERGVCVDNRCQAPSSGDTGSPALVCGGQGRTDADVITSCQLWFAAIVILLIVLGLACLFS